MIKKEEARKEFEKLPEGRYPARCYSIVDFGTHDSFWNGKPKKKHLIRFMFEFPTKFPENSDRPFTLGVTHTYSLGSKSNLRPFLGGWRGKLISDEEVEEGIDMEQFLGMTMIANVAHVKGSDGVTYVNIISNMPLIEGMTCPDQINESIIYSVENHNEAMFQKLSEKMKERIMESDEMQIGSAESQDPKNIHNF